MADHPEQGKHPTNTGHHSQVGGEKELEWWQAGTPEHNGHTTLSLDVLTRGRWWRRMIGVDRWLRCPWGIHFDIRLMSIFCWLMYLWQNNKLIDPSFSIKTWCYLFVFGVWRRLRLNQCCVSLPARTGATILILLTSSPSMLMVQKFPTC